MRSEAMNSANMDTPAAGQDDSAGRGASQKVAAASAGGVIAAFLASLCCVGPVVFGALGVGVGATGFLASTADALSVLVPYRPIFIVLAILGIGISFYTVYKQPRAVCDAIGTCAQAGPKALRALVWIAAWTALTLILSAYWLGFF